MGQNIKSTGIFICSVSWDVNEINNYQLLGSAVVIEMHVNKKSSSILDWGSGTEMSFSHPITVLQRVFVYIHICGLPPIIRGPILGAPFAYSFFGIYAGKSREAILKYADVLPFGKNDLQPTSS